MRVIQLVCSDGFGGVERYVANSAVALAREGVDVAVIGGDRARMRSECAAHGVPWLRGDDMTEAARSLRRLARPDVLNTHMSQADVVGFVHRLRRRGIHQVSTRHFAAARGATRLTRNAMTAVAGRLSAQLSISEYVADAIGEPSTVVYTGVTDRPAGIRRDRVVLVAQRLEPEKDTTTALRAWARAQARRRGWRLQVAGSGSQLDALKRLAISEGVADTVDFLGFRSDIDPLLARAGLVIAPTPREGLGMLVLEAMANATPVIASGAGGHLETVGAIEPKLLFPAGDAEAAARLIDALVDDDAERERAGSALQEAQRARFSVASQIAATMRLYEEVLSR